MSTNMRPARLLVALLLTATLPGLAPYQAAAQSFAARPAAGASATPAGAAVSGASAAGTLTAPSLLAPALLTPSLSAPLSAPSAARPLAASASAAPVASAAAASVAAAAAVVAPAAPAPAAAAAVPQIAAELAAAAPETSAAARVLSARTPRPAAAVSAVAARLSAPTQSSLDALYTGAASAAADDGVARPAEASASAPASALARAEGPRDAGPRTPAPRSTLKRSLAVGTLAGFLGYAFTMVSTLFAGLLGWVPHSNYETPLAAHGTPTALMAAALVVMGSVLAPIAEELVFRAGLQGLLSKMTRGSFVLPALVTSAVFVAVHETADLTLMAVRLVFALTLSWVFHKEGVLASMTAHGVFNGLLFVPILMAALHVPWLMALSYPALAFVVWKAWSLIKSQRAEIASGALVPKRLSGPLALLFLPLLLLGFFVLEPNLFWLAGALGLAVFLLLKAAAAVGRARGWIRDDDSTPPAV